MAKRNKNGVKEKAPKIDGLGPEDLKRIRTALRQAWQWSHAWRLVKKRCKGEDGFDRCENLKCPSKGKPVPKVFVDHINPCGEVMDKGFIERLFVPSNQLQGLCKKCHDPKTKKEAGARATKKRRQKSVLKLDKLDFY